MREMRQIRIWILYLGSAMVKTLAYETEKLGWSPGPGKTFSLNIYKVLNGGTWTLVFSYVNRLFGRYLEKERYLWVLSQILESNK